MHRLSLFVGILVFTMSWVDDGRLQLWGQDVPETLRIGTWNLEWFYDHDKTDNRSKLSKEKSAPTKNDWQWKLNAVARVIGETKPYIMAFQEIENRKVLLDLKKVLHEKYRLSYRVAFVEGFDSFTGQDVGVLFQNGLVEMSRREQNQEQWQSKRFYNLSKHLFTRFEWGTGPNKESLVLVNLHLRASPEKEDLRIKQIKLVRQWIDEDIRRGRNIMVVGDLNTEHGFGKQQDHSDIGCLRGLGDGDASNDLVDLHGSLQDSNRATHLNGKQFDRILFSQSLMEDNRNHRDLVFVKGFVAKDLVVVGKFDKDGSRWENMYSIPKVDRDISDHYPVFGEFEFK